MYSILFFNASFRTPASNLLIHYTQIRFISSTSIVSYFSEYANILCSDFAKLRFGVSSMIQRHLLPIFSNIVCVCGTSHSHQLVQNFEWKFSIHHIRRMRLTLIRHRLVININWDRLDPINIKLFKLHYIILMFIFKKVLKSCF